MKRVFVVLLIFSLLLGLPLPLTAATASDTTGHWAEQSITELMQAGFITGYPDGTFKPDNAVTRAEFLKILISVIGINSASGGDSGFSDVSASDWFFGYVMAAVTAGIAGGYPDGTFQPNAPITREEAAKMVVKGKVIDETKADATSILAAVTDAASISDWAKPFVATAIVNGLMKGDPAGAFRPMDQITRAEAATIGNRLVPVSLGGTFTFARGADSSTLDPAAEWDNEVARATCQIYDTLVGLKGNTTLLEPRLATEWSVSADNLTWTFKLRQGVKFHDGTDFNADALLFNFNRWWDQENTYHGGGSYDAFYETFGGFKGEESSVITAIKKTDDYTVEFTLAQPFSPFLNILSMFSFAIASPTAIQSEGVENFGTNAEYPPVGTGAFKFSSWVKDDNITLVRNEDYWGEKTKVEKLVFRVIPNDSARYLALKMGEIQGMEGATMEDASAAQKDPTMQVLIRPTLNIGTVMFKLDTAPFNDLRIRKAMAMAVNKEAIVKAFLGDFGLVANQMLPPSLMGYNKDLKDYPYDPEAAKALLAEAAPDGLAAIDFWYMSNPRGYFPDPKAIAESIAADLNKAGFNVNLKTEDWATYMADWDAGKLSMWLSGWVGDHGDPDSFLFPPYGAKGPEGGYYENPQVVQLLKEARTIADLNKREELYTQVEAILHEDCVRLFICNTRSPVLLSNKVRGFVVSPIQLELFNTVWLMP